MPQCCIKQCGARKSKNLPNLTLHRFPKNEILKKKWIEAIGSEHINPKQKMWHICSMHFDESCFNRTLDVIRLHDGAVPTLTILPSQKCSSQQPSSSTMMPNKISTVFLCEKQNTSVSTDPLKLEFPVENFTEGVPSVKMPNKISTVFLREKQNTSNSTNPLEFEIPVENLTESVPSVKIPNNISTVFLHEKQNTLDSTNPLKLEFPVENLTESVPSVKIPNKISTVFLHEKQNTLDSTNPLKLEFPVENLTESVPSVKIPNKISTVFLREKQNTLDSTNPLKLELTRERENFTESLKIQQQNNKIRNLTKKCDLLKQKVRSLNEKVRRRDLKIALFCNIIQDLKKAKYINNEESLILDESTGFLKMQVAIPKGLKNKSIPKN